MASRFLERLLQSAGFQDCLKSEVRRHTRRHIPLKCLKTWLTGAVNLPFASSQGRREPKFGLFAWRNCTLQMDEMLTNRHLNYGAMIRAHSQGYSQYLQAPSFQAEPKHLSS